MIDITAYIADFKKKFPHQETLLPWEITSRLTDLLAVVINQCDNEYQVHNQVAIHKTAVLEQNVMIKGPFIAGPGCFIAANAYFREGVFLGKEVKIGPGCEIKSSIIFDNSSVAHFNYIGNSIVGKQVNFEAGSVIANHYNERDDKKIVIRYKGKFIETGIEKFGALVGDESRIGANAVLSPGTILPVRTIVNRLELVDQSGI